MTTEVPARPQWQSWLGFSAMAFGMFLAILDIQVVSSSLIDIQADLNIPASRLSYLQTTYLIAEVIAIALTGWLTRALSTRGLFVAAMIGFVLASTGCATSHSYLVLYGWRFVQGLFGGAIIPVVFSAAFVMFPPARQPLATIIGGGLAMLAPSVGPFVGGWITEHLSWHWLFLINLLPGLIAAGVGWAFVRIDRPQFAWLRRADILALTLLVAFLTMLELALKEGPDRGWTTPWPLAFTAICVVSGIGLGLRSRRPAPLIDLKAFRDRCFVTGAWFSFVLGMALFGATYLLPLFLGLVRDHGPFETGSIMIVTGIAQLLAAPVATVLERHLPLHLLTALGYGLLAAGLLWNGFSTYAWDFQALFIPQVLRGVAIMLCLLPVTRLALGQLPAQDVPNASALFNLMRNIGGAVGLALIDTIAETRPAHHAARIVAKLQAGDRATAAFVGLPLDHFHGAPLGPIDQVTQDFVAPLVRRAALVASLNDAWLLLGGLIAASLLALPLMRRPKAALCDRPAPHSPS